MKWKNFTSKSILIAAFGLSTISLSAQVTTADMNGTTSADLNSIGAFAWVNPSNAQTSDGTFATAGQLLSLSLINPVSVTSHYLTETVFDFSVIPVGATILGVTVKIQHQFQSLLSLNTHVRDHSVKLLVAGTPTGTDHALTGPANNWSTTEGIITYGGPTDTWGVALTPAIVKSSNFGAAIAADLIGDAGISLGLPTVAGVDDISIAITYQVGALVINLQNFSATQKDNTNVLSWTASSDNTGDQFIVQHSADSRNWENLATIPAFQDQHQYTYTDNSPASGPNFYRLFLENKDANGVYSAIQEINNQAVTAISCYPNPFISTITVSSPKPIHSYELRDFQGRTIQSGKPSTSTNSLQLQAAGLPPGLYLLKVDESLFKLIKK
ncbi:T9SS type A sorting domain-containing protein [Flavitalea flava]